MNKSKATKQTKGKPVPSQTGTNSAPKDKSLSSKIAAGITTSIATGIGKDIYDVLLHPLTVHLLDHAHTALQHIGVLTFQSALQSNPGELQRAVVSSDYFLRTAAAINAPGDWPDIATLTDADLETVREAWKQGLKTDVHDSAASSDERARLLAMLEKALLMRKLARPLPEKAASKPRKGLRI